MTFTSKKFTSAEETTIEAVRDGITMFVPNDMGNRDRKEMEDEINSGGDPIELWVAPPITSAQVNQERDRRLQLGFDFAGDTFDFDSTSKANISGASLNAFMAIVAGALVDDLRWHGGASDFVWISRDNDLVSMDAQTVVAFGQAAAAHEQYFIFKAREIKDTTPSIPTDYTDDSYWV